MSVFTKFSSSKIKMAWFSDFLKRSPTKKGFYIAVTGLIALIVGSATYYVLNENKRRKKNRSTDKTKESEAIIERRIVILGLTGAGKSCFLFRLSKVDRERQSLTKTTEGFNLICVRAPYINLNVWEIGGGSKTRQYWIEYLDELDLLVFMVDSSDVDAIEESSIELKKLLANKKLDNVPVLLLANKQDLPGAKSCFELEKQFGLVNGVISGRPGRSLNTRTPPELPTHPSVWEAERLMLSMTEVER